MIRQVDYWVRCSFRNLHGVVASEAVEAVGAVWFVHSRSAFDSCMYIAKPPISFLSPRISVIDLTISEYHLLFFTTQNRGQLYYEEFIGLWLSFWLHHIFRSHHTLCMYYHWTLGLSMIMSIFKYNLIIMGWLWLKYSSSVFTHWSNTFNYHIITIQLQYNITFVFNHINCLSNAVESRQNKWHKAVPAVLNTSKLSSPTS